jgi:hypothetical protein
MHLLDLLPSGLPTAAMKSVTVPGASGIPISPEMVSIFCFAGLAAIAIYVFLR